MATKIKELTLLCRFLLFSLFITDFHHNFPISAASDFVLFALTFDLSPATIRAQNQGFKEPARLQDLLFRSQSICYFYFRLPTKETLLTMPGLLKQLKHPENIFFDIQSVSLTTKS